MFTVSINWKTFACLGVAVIGVVLATKVDKNEAKNVLTHLIDQVSASKQIIDKNDD